MADHQSKNGTIDLSRADRGGTTNGSDVLVEDFREAYCRELETLEIPRRARSRANGDGPGRIVQTEVIGSVSG